MQSSHARRTYRAIVFPTSYAARCSRLDDPIGQCRLLLTPPRRMVAAQALGLAPCRSAVRAAHIIRHRGSVVSAAVHARVRVSWQ